MLNRIPPTVKTVGFHAKRVYDYKKEEITMNEEKIISILGNSEEEILTCICRCAARYMTGEKREHFDPERSVEEQRAVYAYLEKKRKEWEAR